MLFSWLTENHVYCLQLYKIGKRQKLKKRRCKAR
jgi:hypothetical protein